MKIQVKNHFEAGTPVELFGPGIAPYPQTIDEIQTLDGLPKSVCSHPMEIDEFAGISPPDREA